MIDVHCLWIGGPLSAMERLALTSHVRMGHTCRLWTYEPPDNAPQGVVPEDAGQILPRDRVFTYQHGPGRGSVAAFANLFRYTLLCERGGWWADTDVVCLRPFDFPAEYVFASEQTPRCRQVANAVIKAPAGSPVMEYCRRSAQQRDPATLNWGDTGPTLVGEAVRRFRLDAYVVPPETFCPVPFFDVAAVRSRPIDLRSAHAVHLWNEMWRRHGWDKNAACPEGCLFETLKRRFLGESVAR